MVINKDQYTGFTRVFAIVLSGLKGHGSFTTGPSASLIGFASTKNGPESLFCCTRTIFLIERQRARAVPGYGFLGTGPFCSNSLSLLISGMNSASKAAEFYRKANRFGLRSRSSCCILLFHWLPISMSRPKTTIKETKTRSLVRKESIASLRNKLIKRVGGSAAGA
jgi:hypothetical protein